LPRTRQPYAPEFRQQMVQLVQAGRTPEELSREFEPTAQTIHNWVKQTAPIGANTGSPSALAPHHLSRTSCGMTSDSPAPSGKLYYVRAGSRSVRTFLADHRFSV
jgi:hypothetical protein